MSRPLRLVPLLAALAVALAVPAARADDQAEASAHFRKGTALYQQRQWRAAIAEFETAYRLKPHGAIHYNVARCREQLQEWPGALRSYTDYLREVPDARDRATVRAAIGRLEARLAAAGVQALLVYTDPPGAEVRIDGRARGRTPFHLALPPGPYQLALAREGYAPVEQAVEVGADASRLVDVVLRPAPGAPGVPATATATASAARAPAPAGAAAPAPPGAEAPAGKTAAGRPNLAAPAPAASVPLAPAPAAPRAEGRRVYTWVAAGAAVAAVAAGALYGQAAQRKRDELVDGTARDDAASLARDARSKARTANVLYGIAGAAGAAGITLFFVEGTF